LSLKELPSVTLFLSLSNGHCYIIQRQQGQLKDKVAIPATTITVLKLQLWPVTTKLFMTYHQATVLEPM